MADNSASNQQVNPSNPTLAVPLPTILTYTGFAPAANPAITNAVEQLSGQQLQQPPPPPPPPPPPQVQTPSPGQLQHLPQHQIHQAVHTATTTNGSHTLPQQTTAQQLPHQPQQLEQQQVQPPPPPQEQEQQHTQTATTATSTTSPGTANALSSTAIQAQQLWTAQQAAAASHMYAAAFAAMEAATNAAAAADPQSQMPTHPAQPQPPRPTFVNAKQYRRILKRREARAKLEEYYSQKRIQQRESKDKKPYMHESRHRHAMKRPRGPGGRFLTKAELEVYYRDHPDQDPSRLTENGDHDGGANGSKKMKFE